jgi:glycosyltransferase involved in cell wall biosynthesis
MAPAHPPVLVSLRLGGHAGPSGYDRLQEYLGCHLIRPPLQWSLLQRALARLLRPMTRRSGSLWYHRESLLSELGAAHEWLRGSGRVFHYLYGENSYRYLGRMKSLRPGNRIICTYHTPPAKFMQVVKDRRSVERLDAIIVVSTMQADFFSKFVGPERVFFVPHGIDVEYFSPAIGGRAPGKYFMCLFVGSHLRDVATLAEAARLLRNRPDIRFFVVTRPDNHAVFAGLSNVELRTGLSDEQLRDLYRGSDILVLPLLDATANNSLLEAMACGLPILSTDLQGVRDYVNKDCSLLVPLQDARCLAVAISDLKSDEKVRRRMARASRDRALQLSWENVAGQAAAVYRAVT